MKFALCMPYWNNPQMLLEHYRVLTALCQRNPQAHRQLELVICDDASDLPAFYDPHCPIETHIFRIRPPHVLWSQCCATNIAATRSFANWILLTDMDHVVPAETWEELFASERDCLDPMKVYTFKRKNVDGSDYKPHPNSWLMTSRMWEKTKGHDERYRGFYNQDHAFRKRVEHVAGETAELPLHLIRVGRETIPDASCQPEHRANRERDKQEVAKLRAAFNADCTFYADTRFSAPYDLVTR